MNIAIIPARGGSKRIPKKNIKYFYGKPIIAWSIEAAIKSKIFDKVVVSTDDEEIACFSKKFGAEVPFIRPDYISDDMTGTNAVVRHALEWFLNNGHTVDYACCIYATSPFVQIEYILKGYKELIESDSSFAFSVAKYPAPIQKSMRIDNSGRIEALWPKNISKRSQDLESLYHDAGQFYWGKPEAFIDNLEMFSKLSIPVVIPKYLVQDIDDIEDWKRAEVMFKALLSMGEVD